MESQYLTFGSYIFRLFAEMCYLVQVSRIASLLSATFSYFSHEFIIGQ